MINIAEQTIEEINEEDLRVCTRCGCVYDSSKPLIEGLLKGCPICKREKIFEPDEERFCIVCHRGIPKNKRTDSKYCSDTCRKNAYFFRKGERNPNSFRRVMSKLDKLVDEVNVK